MPDPQDFNATAEMMEQMRELRRDVSEIRTTQATQPTRADLQAYVLKEVFDLKVKQLEEKDQRQQDNLDDLESRVQTQVQRALTTSGVVVGIASGVAALLRVFLPH